MGILKALGILHALNNQDKPEEVAMGLSMAYLGEEHDKEKARKEAIKEQEIQDYLDENEEEFDRLSMNEEDLEFDETEDDF